MITICLYWFMVCLYVCMYVSKQGRHVIFIVYANKDITYTHNVPAPPPVGGLGGSYHLQPCIGITICFYWFMYDNYLFVLIYGLFVCMYVCTCPSKVGMSFLLCMQTKILHIHIMFPPPPPVGGLGGVLPSAAMYRYNYMFVLIYVW